MGGHIVTISAALACPGSYKHFATERPAELEPYISEEDYAIVITKVNECQDKLSNYYWSWWKVVLGIVTLTLFLYVNWMFGMCCAPKIKPDRSCFHGKRAAGYIRA